MTIKNIILIIAILGPSLAQGGFQSRVINLTAQTVTADDQFIATESMNIQCKESFTGNGYLTAPHITIRAPKFTFTGTIHCDGTCTIVVQEAFNEGMFTRSGTGTWNIKIEPLAASPTTATPHTNETRKIEVENITFTFNGEFSINFAEAIKQGDTNKVKAFIQEYIRSSDSQMQKSKQLSTYLLMAGLLGHDEIVEELIHAGADVEGEKFPFGTSHLVIAVAHKRSNFVKALLKTGANPNVKDRDWQPALVIAAAQNDLANVQALLQAPNVNVNAANMKQETALMHAAHKGYVAIAKALIEAGADKDARDIKSNTVFDYAYGNDQMIALLYPGKKPSQDTISQQQETKASSASHNESSYVKQCKTILSESIDVLVPFSPIIFIGMLVTLHYFNAARRAREAA